MNFERIAWMGCCVLAASFVPALFLLAAPISHSIVSSHSPVSPPTPAPPEIKLPLATSYSHLPVGTSQDQIGFSIDSVRPEISGNEVATEEQLPTKFLIRLRDSKQMKRIELPTGEASARIGLTFDSTNVLQFSEDGSSFWLECRMLPDRHLSATLAYRTPSGTIVTQNEWTPQLMQTPLQTGEEFAQESPFRELASSKWWGTDLLVQKARGGEPIHRVEIGTAANSRLIDCKVGDWLVFNGKTWEKDGTPLANNPLARIQTANPQYLEWEGWNGTSHVRFRLNLVSAPPLKIKTEELFTQLRVRSEKQVSCTLEKQCLVLRPGDWVLKTAGRWKTLRKAEEKEALLTGEVVGDVFVLEKIGVAPSAKNIVGYYYSAGRTQAVAVEVAQKTQKNRRPSR